MSSSKRKKNNDRILEVCWFRYKGQEIDLEKMRQRAVWIIAGINSTVGLVVSGLGDFRDGDWLQGLLLASALALSCFGVFRGMRVLKPVGEWVYPAKYDKNFLWQKYQLPSEETAVAQLIDDLCDSIEKNEVTLKAVAGDIVAILQISVVQFSLLSLAIIVQIVPWVRIVRCD